MKIAIDMSPVIYETGVSNYTKNLVKSLLSINKENEYVLFAGSLRRRSELEKYFDTLPGSSFKAKVFVIPPTLADVLWNWLHILPIERLVGEVDVFHSSDWSQPPSNAFKVTTIHDLVPLKYPKLSDPKVVSTHKRRFRLVIREVDRVIVPTQTTAGDAIKLGVDKDKIRVIPEAPDPTFKPAKRFKIEKVKRKYRIAGRYILAVGVNPRKNTERIIEAYEKIKAETGFKLVVIGHEYVRLKSPRGVMFLGHLPQEEMPVIYSGAESLVYPSLYEGFGLPILEAFVCKTPVVTSNFGSMAEVAGKGAILVDPYKVDSIAEGISKAIKNKDKLVKLGLKRVKNFSWEKTAKETLKVYSEAKF